MGLRRLWLLILTSLVSGHREDISRISHESLSRIILSNQGQIIVSNTSIKPSHEHNKSAESKPRDKFSRGKLHGTLVLQEGSAHSFVSFASALSHPPRVLPLAEYGFLRPSFAISITMRMLMCLLLSAACLALFGCSSLNGEQRNDTLVETHIELRAQLESLNGLRTISITYAVLYYLNSVEGFNIPHVCSLWPMRYLTVLSGFILYYTTEKRFARFSFITGLVFSTRRSCRLLPTFCIAVLLKAIIEAIFQDDVEEKIGGTIAEGLSSIFPNQTLDILLMSFCFPLLYNLRRRLSLSVTAGTLFFVLVFLPLLATASLHSARVVLSLHLLEFLAGFLSAHLCTVVPSWEFLDEHWWLLFDGSLIWAFFLGATTDDEAEQYLLPLFFCITCIAARGMMESGGSGNHFGYLSFGLTLWPFAPLSDYAFAVYLLKDFSVAVWNFVLHDVPKASWPLLFLFIWMNGAAVYCLVEKPFRKVLDARIFCSYQHKVSDQ